MEDLTLANTSASAPATPAGWGSGHTTAWKEGDFSFRDLLDTINPLQHIPVISTLYRAITGDEQIGNIPRLVGDALFGGPVGLFTGAIGVALKEETGRDIGEHALALVDDSLAPAPTAVATKDGKDAAPAAQVAASAAATPAAASSAPPAGSTVALASTPQTATDAAPAVPPQAAPSAAPVVPDHPPMPLVAAARPASVASSAAAAAKGREGEFAAQYAALQRRIGASPGRSGVTAPVPLQTMAFPTASGRFPASPYAVAPAVLPQNAPVDVSQQMMSALDKYARLHHDQGAAAPGSAVDLIQ